LENGSKLVPTTHIVSLENSSLKSYPSARNGIYYMLNEHDHLDYKLIYWYNTD